MGTVTEMPKSSKCTNTYSCIYASLSAVILAAAAIRYWLIFSKYQHVIENHIEVSTPLNSWKRILEGLYLLSEGINPYEGDLIHETPIALFFYRAITQYAGSFPGITFILFDIATAILLFFTARKYMFNLFTEQEMNKHKYADGSEEYLLNAIDMRKAPLYVAATFLFNPYTIFNCVGFSTTVFFNFFLSLLLFSILHRSVFLSSLFLAICTSVSFYIVILILPMWIYFVSSYKTKFRAILSVTLFILDFVLLLYLGSYFDRNFLFINNVYGFILATPDLRPNIGLFWYFFTEMFDHFRELFIFSFQINATILYLVPLSLRFRNDIFVLITALLNLVTVFKSYPCVGDVGFTLSLLPCYRHLFNYSQQGFLVGVILLIASCLGPIVWHLWIYSNSANANFYFGVTLAFAVAQIFLVTDILFAYVKKEFCLYYGKDRTIDGKKATLVLE